MKPHYKRLRKLIYFRMIPLEIPRRGQQFSILNVTLHDNLIVKFLDPT